MLEGSPRCIPGPPALCRASLGWDTGRGTGAGDPHGHCPTTPDSLEWPRWAQGHCCQQSPRSGGVWVPGGRHSQPPWSGRAMPCGGAASPAQGAGSRVSGGGTGGLSLLCVCLWPTRDGDRIRARGWGMDVGQQETDGAGGPASLLAPLPPPCPRQTALGTTPCRALLLLAAFPIQLLPSLFGRQRGAAPSHQHPLPCSNSVRG